MGYAKKLLMLIIVINVFLNASCTKYNEAVPFFDRLYLEYIVSDLKTVFNVLSADNNKFKIVKTEVNDILGDRVIEMFVDMHGKVYESSSSNYKGKFTSIWIPVHQMEIGDTFDDGYKVLRKDKWKKWEVLVIKNPTYNEEQYFEINTGYLVGVKGSVEVNLVNTNADIPTIE